MGERGSEGVKGRHAWDSSLGEALSGLPSCVEGTITSQVGQPLRAGGSRHMKGGRGLDPLRFLYSPSWSRV
jgi:hypothetical protein